MQFKFGLGNKTFPKPSIGQKSILLFHPFIYLILYFQVGYPTALDVFIIICFFTVFAALVEFAILNFIDTLVRRIKKKDKERKTISSFINNAQSAFYVRPENNGFNGSYPKITR